MKLSPAFGVFLQDIGAGDIHRHQVGRELDAAELQRQRFGQLAHQQRFCKTRHSHQKGMTAGKQTNGQPLNCFVLTDNHSA